MSHDIIVQVSEYESTSDSPKQEQGWWQKGKQREKKKKKIHPCVEIMTTLLDRFL